MLNQLRMKQPQDTDTVAEIGSKRNKQKHREC